MASVGDIYQVRLTCRHVQDQLSENVFYYIVNSVGTGVDADQVNSAVYGNIGSGIRGFAGVAWTVETVSAINGMDNGDFGQTSLGLQGQLSGNTLPPFVMVSVRSEWAGPGTRRGRHFLPCGTASSISANGDMTSGFADGIAVLAYAMGLPMTAGGGNISPVTLSGGFKLGVTPVVSQVLVGNWEYNARFSSIDSRRADPVWFPGEEPV